MDTKRAVAAGAIATATMTALLLVEPSIGLPQIAIGQMVSTTLTAVSSRTAIGPAWGWIIDLIVGIVLALIYAGYFDKRLPGSAFVRGLIFGCIVFVVAQLIFAPITGSGFFSGGDLQLLIGGLLGHLVYGVVVAYVFAASSPAPPVGASA